MHDETVRRLGKVQFVKGSLQGLIRVASDERLEMLAYLLEMALLEAVTLEGELRPKEH